MRFAYNSSGAANHRLDDALTLIAETGYAGVALTLDHHHHDPFAADWRAASEALRRRLGELRLASAIGTNARYLLDPRRAGEPTLVSAARAGRARRVELLKRAIDIAVILRSEAVSFGAGVAQPGVSKADALDWLDEGLGRVCDHAKRAGVPVALQPAPGMLIETVADYALIARRHATLRLALGTGHSVVTGDIDPAEAARAHRRALGIVAIGGRRGGEPPELRLGEGDMDLPRLLAALVEGGFAGLVCVELGSESPRAHVAIPEAMAHLRAVAPGVFA